MVKGKAFLANRKDQYRISHCGEHYCSATSKKSGDHYKYPSLYHFTYIHYYKEMMETKTFLAYPKHQYCVSQYGEHDCYGQNKVNREYYEYPRLSYFTNEH